MPLSRKLPDHVPALLSRLVVPDPVARALTSERALLVGLAANPSLTHELRCELAARKLPPAAAGAMFHAPGPHLSTEQLLTEASTLLAHERRDLPVRLTVARHPQAVASIDDPSELKVRTARAVFYALPVGRHREAMLPGTDTWTVALWWLNRYGTLDADTVVAAFTSVDGRPDHRRRKIWYPRELAALTMLERFDTVVSRIAATADLRLLNKLAHGRLTPAGQQALLARIEAVDPEDDTYLHRVLAETMAANPWVDQDTVDRLASRYELSSDLPDDRFDALTETDPDRLAALAALDARTSVPDPVRWAQFALLFNPALSDKGRRSLQAAFSLRRNVTDWYGRCDGFAHQAVRQPAQVNLDAGRVSDWSGLRDNSDQTLVPKRVHDRRAYPAWLHQRHDTDPQALQWVQVSRLRLFDPYEEVAGCWRLAADRLGENVAAWRVMLELACDWHGSVVELVDAVGELHAAA